MNKSRKWGALIVGVLLTIAILAAAYFGAYQIMLQVFRRFLPIP